jgi:hypothetical protein
MVEISDKAIGMNFDLLTGLAAQLLKARSRY